MAQSLNTSLGLLIPPKLPPLPGFQAFSSPGLEPQRRQSHHRAPNPPAAPAGVSVREGVGDASPSAPQGDLTRLPPGKGSQEVAPPELTRLGFYLRVRPSLSGQGWRTSRRRGWLRSEGRAQGARLRSPVWEHRAAAGRSRGLGPALSRTSLPLPPNEESWREVGFTRSIPVKLLAGGLREASAI